MTVVVDQAALDGLDAQPGGPSLAVAVEFADPTTMTGQDTAAWLRGTFRVRNHADWLLLRATRETCRARADTTTRAEPDEFAPKIAAANLGWSSTTAGSRLDLAVAVLERMPALGDRMRRGQLELAKASAFVTGLEGLTDAQCAAVLAGLLDQAPDLPLGQLRDRILAAGYAVDKVWGANRLAAATARARVTRETAPSGAVNLCGRDLPPELAQDAAHRLRALALAVRARLRAAGHRRALGSIEARVFVRLIDGTLAGAADAEVIDTVTTELASTDPPATTAGHDPDHDPDDAGPADGGPADGGPAAGGPAAGGPADGGPGDGGPDDFGPDGSGPDGSGPDDCGPADDGPGDGGPGDGGPGDGGPDDGGPDDGGADDGGPDDDRPVDLDHLPADPEQGVDPRTADPTDTDPSPADPPTGPSCGPHRAVEFAPGIAVNLPLSTLLGLDDLPGTLPGTGPVPAHTARAAARSHGAANWQILVHDTHGHLAHLLTLRAPPHADRDPRHRRQTVQITAPAALIHALTPDPDPDPGPETDAGAESPELAQARNLVIDEATTTWLRHARDALIASETADPDDHPATTTRDRDRRIPGAALARWIRARDQTCIALGCTRPATACDLDHTTDWLLGGLTDAGDLEPLCRHDHRAKHEGGWSYQQPEPGSFVITDPTGTRHHVQSRVVHPLPTPCEPGHAITPEQPDPPPREDWSPNRTRDGRITDEARATAQHLTRRERRHQHRPPTRYDHDPDF